MKRLFALLVVVAFVASFASMAFGRTLEQERDAVRSYLKVVDAKIIKFRKAGNTAKMKVLQKEKAATLARWEKVKAQLEAGMVTPPPPPPPVAVPPPPPPARAALPPPAAPTGMFGMGLQTCVEGGLVAGMVGLSGNVLLADPMGLGAMVGLPANSVVYKLGVGYAQGNDTNSNTWKAVPITLGGVVMLPADMMGGIESFVGGGLNYVVYRTGQTSGSVGGDIYVGVQGDLGLGGKTYGTVGYSILRTGASDKGAYSSKSVTVQVGQNILL